MELKEGIVVKTTRYLENSKIIYIVSTDGMRSCLARASSKLKSKNYSYTQLFTKIKYDIAPSKRNSFDILTSGEVIDNYLDIKSDFDKLSCMMYILEICYNLSEHIDSFETFYAFLNQIIEKISLSKYYKYYLIIFRLKLLYLLGIGPTFSKCINCGSKENLEYFDFYNGGMKCHDCTNQLGDKLYNGMMVDVMKFLYNMKIENLTDDVIKDLPNYYEDISVFLDEYYQNFLGYHSVAKNVIEKINKLVV